MSILTLIALVILILIVAGILLGRLSWESGIRWLVIIGVLGLLIYIILTYVK